MSLKQVFFNYIFSCKQNVHIFTLILTVLGVISSLDILSMCSVASLLHIWKISCKINVT